MTDPVCHYCGNPKHSDAQPEPLTRERAREIWTARGPQHKLSMRPGECQTVRLVWDRMPGSATFAAAFQRCMHWGSPELLRVQRVYGKGERVRWKGRPGGVAWVRWAAPGFTRAEAYSVVLDDQKHRLDYAGTLVPADELQPDLEARLPHE